METVAVCGALCYLQMLLCAKLVEVITMLAGCLVSGWAFLLKLTMGMSYKAETAKRFRVY